MLLLGMSTHVDDKYIYNTYLTLLSNLETLGPSLTVPPNQNRILFYSE